MSLNLKILEEYHSANPEQSFVFNILVSLIEGNKNLSR